MTKAMGRSALILVATLAGGVLAGFAAPAFAADDLNNPVFVAPPATSVQPSPAQTETPPQAVENRQASSDQLNDTDRNAAATSEASVPHTTLMTATSGDRSVWDETSLIGKVFIGFGAVLTVASAARMFIA